MIESLDMMSDTLIDNKKIDDDGDTKNTKEVNYNIMLEAIRVT